MVFEESMGEYKRMHICRFNFNEKVKIICEFEMDFRKSFLTRSNLSNDKKGLDFRGQG